MLGRRRCRGSSSRASSGWRQLLSAAKREFPHPRSARPSRYILGALPAAYCAPLARRAPRHGRRPARPAPNKVWAQRSGAATPRGETLMCPRRRSHAWPRDAQAHHWAPARISRGCRLRVVPDLFGLLEPFPRGALGAADRTVRPVHSNGRSVARGRREPPASRPAADAPRVPAIGAGQSRGTQPRLRDVSVAAVERALSAPLRNCPTEFARRQARFAARDLQPRPSTPTRHAEPGNTTACMRNRRRWANTSCRPRRSCRNPPGRRICGGRTSRRPDRRRSRRPCRTTCLRYTLDRSD